MSYSPRKPEHADKTEDLGNGYTLERVLQGYAYARNGNLDNPTPRYRWVLSLDGRRVDSAHLRHPLVLGAKANEYHS